MASIAAAEDEGTLATRHLQDDGSHEDVSMSGFISSILPTNWCYWVRKVGWELLWELDTWKVTSQERGICSSRCS